MSWPARKFPPAIDRLLARCEERNGCWHYTGPTDTAGYVQVRHEGPKVLGHRLAYEYFIAPIPEGLTFDHLCQNPACVNPWHGDLVPMRVNIMRQTRGAAVANRAKTHCPKGHPFSPENTLIAPKGNGTERRCRTCRKETCRRYYARKVSKA